MKKNNRKNKQWLQNPDQIKNPKLFKLMAVRNADGSFHLVGGETMVLEKKNQHAAEWVPVDTRDFASVLRDSEIKSN